MHPTCRLPDRAGLSVGLIELAIAVVGVGLQDAGPPSDTDKSKYRASGSGRAAVRRFLDFYALEGTPSIQGT
jgi:hypothetical protein